MNKCINNIQPEGSSHCIATPIFECDSSRKDTGIKNNDQNGERFYEEIRFQSGYGMILVKHRRAQSIRIGFDHDQAFVSICYNLTQRARCTMHNGSRGKKTFERGAGDGVLAYLPQTRGILESPRGEYVLGVSLFFPIDIFLDLFNINGLLLRTSLPLTSRNRRGAAFYHQAKFEPETHLVLRQILQCPYDGEVRKLFMEAKSLELVALKLAELGPAKLGDVSELKKREMEQVREAYQIILESLADPPSLMQLSRVVGLNRNKLNQGFKKLYGDTVFNVLRNARLAKASYLLQNTELSLPEIAYSIGYNSQANFTTAFRQHFGQTPKNVRQNGLPRLSHRQIFMT